MLFFGDFGWWYHWQLGWFWCTCGFYVRLVEVGGRGTWIFVHVFGVWQSIMLSFRSEKRVMLISPFSLPAPSDLHGEPCGKWLPLTTSNEFNCPQSVAEVMNYWSRRRETRQKRVFFGPAVMQRWAGHIQHRSLAQLPLEPLGNMSLRTK